MIGTELAAPMVLASAAEHGFVWWGLIGLGHLPHYLVMGPLIALFLIVCSLMVSWSVKNSDPLIPKDPSQMGITDRVRAVFEVLVEQGVELVDGLMPHHHQGRRYLWLLGSIFVYILTCNLSGLIPGLLPPTDNVNTNAAVAVSVFLLYHSFGLLEVGWGYLKHFWAPPGLNIFMAIPIGILLGGIELFSHAFRPITLSMRLFGNMTGDHIAFSTFLGLLPIGVPIAFMLLGLLVSVVQAYVFTLLSSIYVTLATSHDH